jgi:hypothetical protein
VVVGATVVVVGATVVVVGAPVVVVGGVVVFAGVGTGVWGTLHQCVQKPSAFHLQQTVPARVSQIKPEAEQLPGAGVGMGVGGAGVGGRKHSALLHALLLPTDVQSQAETRPLLAQYL